MTPSRQQPAPAYPVNAEQTAVTVDVESRLMQNYRVGSPVHAGSDVVPVRNRDGQIEIFTQGADGTIWQFQPDPSSDSGYRGTSTGYKASTFNVVCDPDGTLVVFITDQLELYYITKSPEQDAWEPRTQIDFSTPPKAEQIEKIIIGDMGGQPYVGLLVRFDSAFGDLFQLVYSVWDRNDVHFELASGMVTDSANCVWLGTDSDTAVFTTVDGRIVGYQTATKQIVTTPSEPFTSVDVSATNVPGAPARIFAILKSKDGVHEFVPGTSGAKGSWTAVATGRTYRQVLAVLDGDNATELFAVSDHNQFVHWQPDDTTQTRFDDGAEIDTNVASINAPATSGDVYLSVVGTTQEMLSVLYREADSSNWVQTRVELPSSDNVEEYTSYSSDVNFYDAHGALLINTPVVITVSEISQLRINGGVYTAAPHRPVRVTTNATGTLSIVRETPTLATPTIGLNVPSQMDPQQTITLHQDAEIHDQLHGITGQDLMDAKVADGSPLLDDEHRNAKTTNALATALNHCMDLQVPALDRTQPLAGYLRSNRGVGLLHSGTVRDLSPLTLPDGFTPWRLAFDDAQNLTFQELDPAEAIRLVAQRTQDLPSVDGLFSWVGDIGDFLSGVANGAIEVVETVVTAVGDAVHAAITGIIDGAKYLYNAVVHTIEEAYDLAQVVLAKVKVFFKRAAQWIGFIFEWDDILRTRDATVYTIRQFLGFCSGAIDGAKQFIDDGFDAFQERLSKFFDDGIANIAGDHTIGGYQKENTPKTPAWSSATANTVVLNAVTDHAGAAAPVSAPVLSLSKADQDNLADLLTQLADNTMQTPEFAEMKDWFNILGSNPDQLFKLLLSELMRLAKGLATAVVSGTRAVVDAVLAMMKTMASFIEDLLEAEWNIPLVTPLYKSITNGSALTLLDVTALIAAIPATVAYKIIHGAAPFPDAASVSNFTDSFTSETLLRDSGLGPKTAEDASGPHEFAPLTPTDQTIVAFIAAGGMYGFGATRTFLDVDPPGLNTRIELIADLNLAFKILFSGYTVPWLYGDARPGCHRAEELRVTNWLYSGVIGTLFLAIFTRLKHKPVPAITQGVIVTAQTVYGLIHLGLAIPSANGVNGWKVASLIIPPVSEIIRLARLKAIVDYTGGWSLLAVGLADWGGNEAAAALTIYEHL